jgi:hypothetical protein
MFELLKKITQLRNQKVGGTFQIRREDDGKICSADDVIYSRCGGNFMSRGANGLATPLRGSSHSAAL